MRATLSLLCLVFLLSVAQPADAQLREDVRARNAPTQLYGSNTGVDLFNKLFSDEHFRMAHSYEMSFSSFGGNSASMGMYTNTMMWQFSDELAARVDVSLAHSPFGGTAFGQQDQNPRVFLRNAEVAYRPAENVEFRFMMRQSPYGSYMGPYGASYSPYQRTPGAFGAMRSHDLFWNDRPR